MSTAPRNEGGRPGWYTRLLGDRDRLGWWLVPLFLMVGLGGAVLAGSLTVVYYAQQVNQLEQETRTAREEVVGAADDVREAAEDARESIDDQVASARAELARDLPLGDALELGVVRLEVDAQLEASSSSSSQGGVAVGPASADEDAETDDQGEGGDDGAGADDQGEAGNDGAGADDQGESGDDGPDDGTDAPPPPEPVTLRRAGAGFVVVVDGEVVFLATSLGLLDDPRTDERVPADVEVSVRLAGGTTTATVHSWDAANDLLLLRAQIRNVEPLPWREEGRDVSPGDRVVAIGATPELTVVRLGAEVAGVSPRAIVTSLPTLRLVAGGPVVDIDGDVVGVSSANHGALQGDPVVIPIRRLCDDLLSACPE